MNFNFLNKEHPVSIGPDTNANSGIIFIHGLGGGYWTWKSFAVTLKKKWNEKDSYGLEFDEYYDTQFWLNRVPIIRKLLLVYKVFTGPGIDKLSIHLKAAIEEACDEYDNVIIIGHSMGGLVARRYIVDLLEQNKSLGKIKALITYATPHKGSKWANNYLTLCYHFFRHFIKDSKQISQLSKTGEFITSLNLEWSKYNVDSKIDYYRVAGLADWVVDVDSSMHYNDKNAKTVANKGHFNIIKPFRRKDIAFMVSYNYLKDFRNLMVERSQIQDELDHYEDEIEEL